MARKQSPLDPRSIRGLSLILCFVIAVLVAIVTERIAVTTGDKALEDTRDTMETTRTKCFRTGGDNVRRIASDFIKASGDSVTTLFKAYFGAATNIANNVGRFLQVAKFDDLMDEQWLDQVVQPMLYQSIYFARQEPGRLSGVAEAVVSIPLPALKLRGVASGDEYIGEKLTHHSMFAMSNQPGAPLGATTTITGNCDDRGQMIPLDLEPNETMAADGSWGKCDRAAAKASRYVIPTGRCIITMESLAGQPGQPGIMDLVNRGLMGSTDPADTPLWMPATRIAAGLSMYTYYLFSNPQGFLDKNKIGMIQVGTNALQSDAFLAQETANLPDESRMYAIEKNPWSGYLLTTTKPVWSGIIGWGGTVVGVSRGSSVKQIPCNVEPGYDDSCAEEMRYLGYMAGTRQYDEIDDSIMRSHAIDTMAVGGNYTTLVEMTRDDMQTWTLDMDDSTWWTKGSLIEDLAGLKLYLTVMVPREAVMREIDAAETATLTEIDVAKKKTEDDLDKGRTVMYIVLAIVVLVVLGVSVVFTHMITAPLRVLAREMQRVAMLELDTPLAAYSMLAEVRNMQRSFGAMVRNLREFRTFMPASLLHKDQDDDEEEAAAGANPDQSHMSSRHTASKRSHAQSRQQGTQQATTVASSRSAAVRNFLKSHTQSGLKKKKISLMVMNLCDTHTVWASATEQDLLHGHAKAFETILTTLAGSKGIPDSFSGDRLLSSWNAVNMMATHRKSSAIGMLHCKDGIMKQQGPGGKTLCVAAAAASGEARVGNMGTEGMKKFSFISRTVTLAYALERLARHGHTGVFSGEPATESRMLCDSGIRDDTKGNVFCSLFDTIEFKKNPIKKAKKEVLVYQVRAICQASEDEWMYQLEQGEAADPWAGWNAGFHALMQKDYETAAKNLEDIGKLGTPEAERVAGMIRDQTEYPVTEIRFH